MCPFATSVTSSQTAYRYFNLSCVQRLSLLIYLLYGIRSTGATEKAIDARRKGEDSKVFCSVDLVLAAGRGEVLISVEIRVL